MADFNSSLPVRSEADGTDARVQVKIVDGVTPSTIATVDSDKNVHIEAHGNAPAGTDEVLRLSELGAVTPDGLYDATNNTKPGNLGLITSTRVASPGDTTQTQRLTSITDTGGTVRALDISLHDQLGNAYTETNPLFVTSAPNPGTEINDYNTAAAVAAAGTSNHDYTVTAGKTLSLSQVWYSASGKMKAEVQIETGVATGIFNTKFVGFNSTAEPSNAIPIKENILVAAGVRVRVIRTNKDNQAEDLYTTISGHEN